MSLDFGDYCTIEQKRYGVENEQYTYKVIGRGMANYFRSVPVDANATEIQHGEMCEVVKAICCGVCEEKVETFRLQDIKPRLCRNPSRSKGSDLIEEWIESGTATLAITGSDCIRDIKEMVVRVSYLRELLKTHALVPREPTDEMIESATKHHECVQQDSWYSNSEIPESDCADIYKATLQANEKGE